MSLWTYIVELGQVAICNPDGKPQLLVINNDIRFARALTHVLNGGSSHKFSMSHEEMDFRGVAKEAK